MGRRRINTTRFGAIEVEDELVLSFVSPILGFDEIQSFVILDHAENSPFKWLQAIESPELAFVITNPTLFGMEYDVTIPPQAVEKLGLTSEEDALVVTIVNIPQDDPSGMTANLLGPIVINQQTRKALQVVLGEGEFSTRTRLLPDNTAGSRPTQVAAADRGE
ncbi:MAG: flagellar assembly protein FliW [Vampirovibrionales bacterium]|nr:flagellar assembly protein FliW [Vampirovibrionales bacterium]